MAVVRVFGELSFEGVHAFAQGEVFGFEGLAFGFEEGEVGCELIAEQSSSRKRGVSACRYTSLISTWIVLLRSLRVRPRVSPSRCQLAAR